MGTTLTRTRPPRGRAEVTGWLAALVEAMVAAVPDERCDDALGVRLGEWVGRLAQAHGVDAADLAVVLAARGREGRP